MTTPEAAPDLFRAAFESGRSGRGTDTDSADESQLPDAPRVIAQLQADDGTLSISFDAARALAGMSDEAIVTLAEEGWGLCQEADELAYRCESENPQITQVLAYVRRCQCGFGVQLDPDHAEHWVHSCRPHLAARLPDRPDTLR